MEVSDATPLSIRPEVAPLEFGWALRAPRPAQMGCGVELASHVEHQFFLPLHHRLEPLHEDPHAARELAAVRVENRQRHWAGA
jgi:hypothetical protein